MKTLQTYGLIALLAFPLVLVGCGGDDDDGPNPPSPPTDEEVRNTAWAAFAADDLATAEASFRELLGRGNLIASARNGLGWTFAVQSVADSARAQFTAGLADTSGTAAEVDQMYAGLALAEHALGNWQALLDAAGEVPAGWTFPHDTSIDRDTITLLEAVGHYALGEFAESLAMVQVIDPTFDADVSLTSGRALLAARIEELLIS